MFLLILFPTGKCSTCVYCTLPLTVCLWGLSVPSPIMPAVCQLHPGILSCLSSLESSVFISEIPSCVCQLQWKARDTTESRSRLNRFHAISAILRGICLPLAEETFSHSGGFMSSWCNPMLPVLRMKLHLILFSPLRHSLFPTCDITHGQKKKSRYDRRKSALQQPK